MGRIERGVGMAANRVTRTWYTARGEAAYVVDAEGYVSLTAYDAAGQATSVKTWDHAISVSDSTTFAQVTTAIASDTYVTSSFEYDSLGRVTAEVDAARGLSIVIVAQYRPYEGRAPGVPHLAKRPFASRQR